MAADGRKDGSSAHRDCSWPPARAMWRTAKTRSTAHRAADAGEYQKLIILLPCHSPEDFPTYHEGMGGYSRPGLRCGARAARQFGQAQPETD
jgi:hypothetical protein